MCVRLSAFEGSLLTQSLNRHTNQTLAESVRLGAEFGLARRKLNALAPEWLKLQNTSLGLDRGRFSFQSGVMYMEELNSVDRKLEFSHYWSARDKGAALSPLRNIHLHCVPISETCPPTRAHFCPISTHCVYKRQRPLLEQGPVPGSEYNRPCRRCRPVYGTVRPAARPNSRQWKNVGHASGITTSWNFDICPAECVKLLRPLARSTWP
jgi:hypothetical protein